ncbi:hypothetical protein ABIB38_002842 [Massilia sp. UYP11]|uniref:hypothetical protein n=1 Tax=Massilia sp. UYP11 TaxID=1756385 RepID=UPI003D1B617B
MAASHVDVTLTLLPLIGLANAEQMLIGAGVPRTVLNRVLTHPAERRPMIEPEVKINALPASG